MPRRPQVADIDAYIASADSQAQPILNTLQHLIHQEIPEAEEKILYNMPFFLVNGKKIGIAAYKAHVSFQISDDLSADLLAQAKQLGYETGHGLILRSISWFPRH